MRPDKEIENEIRRLEWKRYQTPSHSPENDEIEARLHRLELELRDPAALVPETDLREVYKQKEN